jgi:hypothetical protein
VGFEVLTTVVMKSSFFWDIMLHSPFESQPTLHATCFTLVSGLAYSSPFKMEVTCFSEVSVDFQWNAQCYIPEDRILATKIITIFPISEEPLYRVIQSPVV